MHALSRSVDVLELQQRLERRQQVRVERTNVGCHRPYSRTFGTTSSRPQIATIATSCFPSRLRSVTLTRNCRGQSRTSRGAGYYTSALIVTGPTTSEEGSWTCGFTVSATSESNHQQPVSGSQSGLTSTAWR